MKFTDEQIERAHKALMSELFLYCQPDRGDVFAFMDDHPELLRAALAAAAIPAEPPPKPMADWSNLPKDIYVIEAFILEGGIAFDVKCCSVPMVTAPEVRYTRADLLAAAAAIPAEPVAWQTLDGERAITKADLAGIEATDKPRGEAIRIMYPTPLYATPQDSAAQKP